MLFLSETRIGLNLNFVQMLNFFAISSRNYQFEMSSTPFNFVFVLMTCLCEQQLAILGTFTGTLFYQVPDTNLRTDMDLRKSLAFIAIMTLSLNTISQIPVQLDERTVIPSIIALSHCNFKKNLNNLVKKPENACNFFNSSTAITQVSGV